MAEKSKEQRIKKELDRLEILFEKVDGNKKTILASLLQNAAFMRITLEDLQEVINAEGVTDEYQNGANQRGIKQSATLQGYNALIKNYTIVIKALIQLLPPEERKTTSIHEWHAREKTPEEIEEERLRDEEHRRKINAEIEAAAELQRKEREASRIKS